MDEKTKDEQKMKKSASPEILEELQNFKKICSSRCSICHSGLLKEVHEFYNKGLKLDEIVAMAKERGVQLSTPSLSRHFKSYRAFKLEMATKIIKNDVLREITSQAVHLEKTVELLDMAYDKIKVLMEANTYRIDISDLEKLAKIRYQILAGENLESKDVMAVFQKATDKYGLNIQQGVLKI